MSQEQFRVRSSCVGALEMKGGGQAVMWTDDLGTDGTCPDKSVTRMDGRVVGRNWGR